MNPAYHQDEEDDVINMYPNVETSRKLSDEDNDIPVYAQVDLAKRERDREDSRRLEELSDDMII
jgi:hypothetical protein